MERKHGGLMENLLTLSIDHGYKHMKSENLFFPTSISELSSMPDDTRGILKYNNHYYTENGEPVLNVDTQVKTDSDEFYLLTLIALAKELNKMQIYNAEIRLLGGLPQRWYDRQKSSFKEYLFKNGEDIFFEYEGKAYNIIIREVWLFEQGYAALFALENNIDYIEGEAVIVDIGGGTIDILPIYNGQLKKTECKIDTKATIYLNDKIKEEIEAELNTSISDVAIIDYIKRGSIDIPAQNPYEEVMKRELCEYTSNLYKTLKKHRINVDLTPIIFVGGGAGIMEKFTENPPARVEYVTDLCANAQGYKVLFELLYE